MTRRALSLALGACSVAGATVDLIDLVELNLPFCGGPGDADDHPGVTDLKRRVVAADAVILATPEYHNSFSGVLKNALDLMGSRELEGKLFGLVGIAGGRAGATNALGHLRIVLRGVRGWTLPEQISIPQAETTLADGAPADPDLGRRLAAFGGGLVRYARTLAEAPEANSSVGEG